MLAALAHNLIRWVAALGLGHTGSLVVKTVRRQLIDVPGRLTRSARRLRLSLPRGWPWEAAFLTVAERLRSIPLAT